MKPHAFALAGAALLMGAAPLGAQSFDRTQRPAPGPTPEVRMPDVDRRTLPNGLTLWVVSNDELPTINASLVIRAGAAQDGDTPGLASVTAALMDEGAGGRDALAFARAVDALGANLSVGASDERTTVSLSTLVEHADAAFALLGDLVTTPALAAEELERERASRLQSLRQQRDQPTTIANLVFARQVYGEHPYGRPSQGTIASIEGITRDDVATFYRTFMRPNNAVMVIVGNVTADRAEALVRGALGRWERGTVPAAAARAPEAPAARSAAAVYLVDKPGAAQSEIRIGHVGAPRQSPDYYALEVMNAVLGGQFTSRINLNLRESKGFTYGARSGFSFDRGAGPFTASAGVFTAKTDSSLMEFMKELRDIRGGRPVTAEEVAFAKAALVRSYPRRIETNAGVAGQLANLAFFGLPPEELANYVTEVEEITAEDVTRVARQYVRPDRSVIVVVGDLDTIRPGIEALGLGPITVLEADGSAPGEDGASGG